MGGPKRQLVAVSSGQVAVEHQLRGRLPKLLQAEREARGWTQEILAEKAGVHSTTVGKVERGKQLPSIALLVLLARALETPLGEILAKVLPEGDADGDETIRYVRELPRAERKRLLPVLMALVEWKRGGSR